jgi:hypothetical protein
MSKDLTTSSESADKRTAYENGEWIPFSPGDTPILKRNWDSQIFQISDADGWQHTSVWDSTERVWRYHKSLTSDSIDYQRCYRHSSLL